MKIVSIAAACLLSLAAGWAAELRGVEYSRPNGVRLRLDAKLPEGSGPFPAAILVHGGAWVAGSRRFDVKPLFKPLTDAGFAWFSISYRLARKLPTQGAMIDASRIADGIDDVQQAVTFVRSHAAEFHVDSDRIVLIGESAGAQLASMAAIRGAPVKAVVAFYCPTDLVAISSGSGIFRRAVARLSWGSASQPSLRELSPISGVRPGMPPFLFVHGTRDPVVPFEQSVRMCDEMHKAGVSCDVIPVRGGLHGVRLWEAFHKTSYKRDMADWLSRTVGERN
jgi:acetyl esterase